MINEKETRKTYQLTRGNERKITVDPADIDKLVAEFSASYTGKTSRKGMAVRNYKLSLISQTREYIQGCWQGKLDNASGLEYTGERNDTAYNLGYYRGYNENTSGYLDDAIDSNPNFAHLKK